MNIFEIKKVIPVENTLNIEECEKFLISEKFCLGILNEEREIVSYVLKEDIEKLLKYNIKKDSINLIATLAEFIDIDIENIIDEEIIKTKTTPGLNNGIFIGKNKKNINHLIINKNFNNIHNKSLLDEYEKKIPEKIKKALNLCSTAADKISMPIFLIGGIVRDIIIDKEIFDIDITVQGNAIEFSKLLRKEYPYICKIKEIHEEFKTTKITFKFENEEIELDIASTRKEVYPYAASLPKILEIGCNIYEDIMRRDFSINAMALSLNQNNFCQLIDPYDGYNDLANKKIKILHPLSFIDDPTRIIRGLKFSVRFEFQIDTQTALLQEKCLNSGLFDNLGGERTKSEIKQTFNLNNPLCLEKFISKKIYYLLAKNIDTSKDINKLAKKCHRVISEYKNFISSKDFIWLIYIGSIIINLPGENFSKTLDKMFISGLETEILIGAKTIYDKLDALQNAETRFNIYEQLEGYFTESILINLVITDDNSVKANVDLHLRELQNIKIFTTGKTLIEHGFTPGPTFGNILKEILQAKINREIRTEEDEEEYIKKFSKKLKYIENP